MPRPILVAAPNWIGDAVMAIPFLRALARADPGGERIVLGRPGPSAVLGAALDVEILPRAGTLADAIAIRRRQVAEAWLLPNSFRSAVAPFLARVPERIGYSTDRRAALLTVTVAPPSRTSHQLRDYDALLRRRGIEPDHDAPRLTPSPQARGRADAALAAAGIPTDAPLVLLAPGAAFGWTKRWPPERFGLLAAHLRACGREAALVIGPGEEEIASEAVAAARAASPADAPLRPLPVLGSDLDPVELAALLARASAVVGNDSGPMHLAAAVGTPVVALFGPTDPGRTAPTGAPARIIDRYVFCSPCFLKECPYSHECMTEISVERVFAAVEGILGQRS
jgi:heptosyltransferase-2